MNGRSIRSARLLPRSLPELWTFLGIALPVLGALIAGLSTTDLAYHLRAGAEVLDGRIPDRDAWTFTVGGRPWLDQQWLAQGILAAVHGLAGWTGMAVLRAALVGVIMAAIAAAIRARAPGLGPRRTTLLVLAAFVVAAVAMALRPQLFGMALFALTLLILERHRGAAPASRGRSIWLVPVIAVGWANLHGSFVFAPVLVAFAFLEALAERRPGARTLGLVFMATVVATAVTPFGAAVWPYALGLGLGREVTARVTEWQPTTLRDVPGLLYWGSVAAVVLLLARRRLVAPWPTLAALGAFAALGAWAVRGLAWWPLIAAVAVAGLLNGGATPADGHRPARETRPSRLPGAVALLVVAGIVAAQPAWRPLDAGLEAPANLLAQAPSGMTARLRDLVEPGDRIWNPQPWGSWFEYALPDALVAWDSRIELFGAERWAVHDTVAAAGRLGVSTWSDLLDADGVSIVVTAGSGDGPLADALHHDVGWRPAYSDADGTIWVRVSRR